MKLICRATAELGGSTQAPRSSKNSSSIIKKNQSPQVSQITAPPPPASHALSDSLLDCTHFNECSGCSLQHSGEMSLPPTALRAQAFFNSIPDTDIADFQVHIGDIHGWRYRARLAVRRDETGLPCVGLFRQRSHDIVDIPQCRVHHPLLNQAADLIRSLLYHRDGPAPYDEATNTGQLRYLQLTVVNTPDDQGSTTSRVQVVLVWNAPDRSSAAGLDQFTSALWAAGHQDASTPPLLHSIWANYQPKPTNTILGEQYDLLYGEEVAWVRYGEADVCIDPPGSFIQSNVSALTTTLTSLQRFIPPGGAVADLHAGVGTIGLFIAAAQEVKSLRLVEIVGAGQAAFQRSIEKLQQGAFHGDSQYYVASAGSQPEMWLDGAQVAILDPPRKGLDPELLAFLCSSTAVPSSLERLCYLSCGFAALERDCAALLDSGHWRLRHAEGHLFFPGSDHVETLAVFDHVLATN